MAGGGNSEIGRSQARRHRKASKEKKGPQEKYLLFGKKENERGNSAVKKKTC